MDLRLMIRFACGRQGQRSAGVLPGRRRPSPRHRAAGDRAGRGEEGLRTVAQALGGRAQLCVGGALATTDQGLRATARGAARIALPGLCHLHAAKGNSTADSYRTSITLSSFLNPVSMNGRCNSQRLHSSSNLVKLNAHRQFESTHHGTVRNGVDAPVCESSDVLDAQPSFFSSNLNRKRRYIPLLVYSPAVKSRSVNPKKL